MTTPTTTPRGIAYEHLPGPADRPSVLFLHAGVADRRMWDDHIAALKPRCGALRVDLRGFGDSATGVREWTHVDDVIEVLDNEDLTEVDVVAASFGSGVAIQLALRHPERVSSLVIAPPGGVMLLTVTPALRAFIDAEEAALQAGDLDATVEANIDAWVAGAGRVETDVPARVCDRVRIMQRRAFELADRIGEPLDADDEPFARASQLTVPTLIIVGTHDMDTSIDAAQQWAKALPHAYFEEWGDVAHLPSMEQPGRFNARLASWLAQHQR